MLPLAAGFLIHQGKLIPGIALIAVFELILFLMIPQVMIHMVMPLTKRGWMMHIQFKAWGKSLGASVYWCGITFVAVLPALVPVALAGGIGFRGVNSFVLDMKHNYTANATLGEDLEVYYAARNNPKKNETAPIEPKGEDPKYELRKIRWKGAIFPAIGLILSELMFGFGAVFAMRANGNFGLYFKRQLKLETLAKDVKWVAKGALSDDDPAVIKAKKKQQLIQNIGATVAFLAVMGGLGWWFFLRKPEDPGAAVPAVQPGDPAAAEAAPGGAPPGTPAGAVGLAPPM